MRVYPSIAACKIAFNHFFFLPLAKGKDLKRNGVSSRADFCLQPVCFWVKPSMAKMVKDHCEQTKTQGSFPSIQLNAVRRLPGTELSSPPPHPAHLQQEGLCSKVVLQRESSSLNQPTLNNRITSGQVLSGRRYCCLAAFNQTRKVGEVCCYVLCGSRTCPHIIRKLVQGHLRQDPEGFSQRHNCFGSHSWKSMVY